MGFDDISFSALSSPELTTISQPIHEMAEKAVEVIVNQEKTEKAKREFVFAVKLVKRETTLRKTHL